MNINNIPFEPKVTAEEVILAENWLRQNSKNFSSTANFGVVANGRIEPYIRQSCHKMISTPLVGTSGFRSVVATEIGTSRSKREYPEDIVLGFLDWLINTSPYSRFILTKDLDFASKYGVVVSADVATPLMQNIMILTRHFYEVSGQAFEKFNELVASGVDPMIAYPVCFCSNWSSAWTKPEHVVQSCHAHRAHPLFNLKAFRNWIKGDLSTQTTYKFNNATEHFRHNAQYLGGTLFFFEKGDIPIPSIYDNENKTFLYDLVYTNQEFRDALAVYRGLTVSTSYSPPNPFKRQDTTTEGKRVPLPHEITFQELWEFALPWCIKEKVFTND